MCASILYTGVGEIQSSKLHIGILIPYSSLQRAHGVLGLYGLGAYHIGDLEVQRHVLYARRSSALDLLVERAVGRRAKPACHAAWRDVAVEETRFSGIICGRNDGKVNEGGSGMIE